MDNAKAVEIFNKWMDCKDAYQADPSCDGKCLSCEYYASAEEEKEAMQTAITALEKQERDSWHVIAKDGLPKKDGDYLVCYEEGYREDYSLDEIGIAPFEVDCEGFGIWVESFDKHTLGSLGSDWTEIKATAWKPLPEKFNGD